ncbi:penicillin-binding protein activator LpoB [Fangia hongkongensis]|uniref:penicillin-binding protein activator LpoB n=1 Tax=Fangia hongkongensis TaxID=270495 RepID=UPI000368B0EC|nr:penicillin-binding protein activator LpoB [Fangia hongkongensis]MBK2123646.1 penicillin-binding protein activator LpoB [Fangia hongkongensis]
MKKLKLLSTLSIAGVSALLIAGCSSNPNVSYVDPQGVDTTSINFNSTDLQTTTQKMVSGMMSSPAVARITADGKQPVVFFSTIRNETAEHINTNMLANTVSTEVINSGKFRFTDMSQVKQMKQQMDYQAESGMVDQKTATKMGQQIGAQYMIYGSIADMQSMNSDQQSLFYLITLKMIDIKTGVIIWQDQKQIRKVQKRSSFGW